MSPVTAGERAAGAKEGCPIKAPGPSLPEPAEEERGCEGLLAPDSELEPEGHALA